MPISVKISYISLFHTLNYSFASLKEVNVEWVEELLIPSGKLEDNYLKLPGLYYILP